MAAKRQEGGENQCRTRRNTVLRNKGHTMTSYLLSEERNGDEGCFEEHR